ncbi:MAG: hypothetical protein ACOVSR_08160 [Bacteroidia bacterium]
MKRILTLIIGFSLISAKVFGQANWIEPENPDVTKKIRIYVDLTKTTNRSCADSTGPFYIWTWLPKEHPVGHPLRNGFGEKEWQNSNEALKMTNDAAKGPLVWYYEMVPTEFYEVPAADVYKKGISLLVKTKNGGGYGAPDVKTEDLNFTIEPPKTDRGAIYSAPSSMALNEVANIIYDNNFELNDSMTNVSNDDLYAWVSASIKDTATSVTRTFAPSSFFNVASNPDLKLIKVDAKKYRLSFIPNKLFNVTSNKEVITQIEVTVRRGNYAGPNDKSEAQPKLKFACQ